MTTEKKRAPNLPSDTNQCDASKIYSSAPGSVIADLDSMIEKYINWWLYTEKPKGRPKYEDLDVDVNWKKLVITQEDAVFEQGTNDSQPSSVTLFKTQFINRTSQPQQFSFKTERTTRQVCGFSFNRGFSREAEASVSIKIPGDILEIGGGIKSEQTVEYGKEQSKEEEITWGCDSTIEVNGMSRCIASLVISETELERYFSITAYMKGHLVIKLSDERSGFFFSIHTRIDQLIDMVKRNNWLTNEAAQYFEIIQLNGEKVVKSTILGKCKFRLGISQKIEIEEQSI